MSPPTKHGFKKEIQIESPAKRYTARNRAAISEINKEDQAMKIGIYTHVSTSKYEKALSRITQWNFCVWNDIRILPVDYLLLTQNHKREFIVEKGHHR
jgi:hypothetical protein